MAVIRKYETKLECVGLFMEEMFNFIDASLITDNDDWREHWEFVSAYDKEVNGPRDECDFFDENDELVYYSSDYSCDGTPAWQTWFEINDEWLIQRIQSLAREVCDECGFVFIYRDYYLWGLGIDGAGYSFRDSHFKRLYDLLGFHWHE